MGLGGHEAEAGTPLLQVFSVTIKPLVDTVHHVYGAIQVRDELGEEYLYKCDSKDAATVRHQGKLVLLKPERPTFATADFTVTFDLKEKDGNTEFVKESFTWNGPNLFSYNSCLSHDFRGKLGVATVYFSVLSVGVDAIFRFRINENVGIATNIYGRIVAYYGRNFEFLAGNNDFRVILFDRTCKEVVELNETGCIPLSPYCLSVPSYSSLKIEATLNYTRSNDNTNGSINSKLEIPAWSSSTHRGQDGAFFVDVGWIHPNEIVRLPSLEIVRDKKFHLDGCKLFELFSARIFYDQTIVDGSVEVSGGIRVDDNHNDMSLFSSRKDSNLILPDGTLALTGPTSSIRGSLFDLSLDLKERHQKFAVDGYLRISPSEMWEWLDTFTFAAISGINCYAVLHFAIFRRAVQAELEVTLSSIGDTTIHGSLIAYYQNYGYNSNYLKKYFQTRLLDVPEDKAIDVLVKPISVSYCASSVSSDLLEDELMPECGNDTILLKHKPSANEGTIVSLARKVVAVPDKSSLTIEANLSCTTRIDLSETVTHLVNGSANFHPQTSGTTSARIWDKDVVIDVKVSWSNWSYNNCG